MQCIPNAIFIFIFLCSFWSHQSGLHYSYLGLIPLHSSPLLSFNSTDTSSQQKVLCTLLEVSQKKMLYWFVKTVSINNLIVECNIPYLFVLPANILLRAQRSFKGHFVLWSCVKGFALMSCSSWAWMEVWRVFRAGFQQKLAKFSSPTWATSSQETSANCGATAGIVLSWLPPFAWKPRQIKSTKSNLSRQTLQKVSQIGAPCHCTRRRKGRFNYIWFFMSDKFVCFRICFVPY